MNKFILLHEPRSGSNLLNRILSDFVRIHSPIHSIVHLDNPEFNVNHNYRIYPERIREYTEELQMLSDHKIIFLSRRDKLKQAISLCRLHSLEYRKLAPAKKEESELPEDFMNFSDELLEECILSTVWLYATANTFILEGNREVLRLYYEDDLENSKDWEHTLTKALNFLDIPIKEKDDILSIVSAPIIAETYKKISGEKSDEIYKAFLSDFFSKFRCP